MSRVRKKTSQKAKDDRPSFRKYFRRYWQLYAMMALPFCWLLLFKYGPMLGNILAFRRFKPLTGPYGVSWAEPPLRYFRQFLGQKQFWQAFRNTLIISIMNLAVNFPVPIIFAILLNELRNLKIISFGPRPQDFLACNAPIKQLYNLDIEIEENSELDLFEYYNAHAGDERIQGVIDDMKKELGAGNKMEGILPKLAQYELTLLDWAEAHKGSREYVIFANKCWPAFQTQFGFVPCYVNSRLAANGIPVACEVDIYGALSEYIGTCVSEKPCTLLDINNSVPSDIYNDEIAGKFPYVQTDTFMGFHCGNTAACMVNQPEMKFQRIMKRNLEPDGEPNITRGTLEGDIKDGNITFFRIQSTADAKLRGYVAQGEVLPVATRSFGSIGIFAIDEMGRFYRHVLIQKNYPHHGAVAFGHYGREIYEVFKYLGMTDIGFNQPKGMLYKTENPFG